MLRRVRWIKSPGLVNERSRTRDKIRSAIESAATAETSILLKHSRNVSLVLFCHLCTFFTTCTKRTDILACWLSPRSLYNLVNKFLLYSALKLRDSCIKLLAELRLCPYGAYFTSRSNFCLLIFLQDVTERKLGKGCCDADVYSKRMIKCL